MPSHKMGRKIVPALTEIEFRLGLPKSAPLQLKAMADVRALFLHRFETFSKWNIYIEVKRSRSNTCGKETESVTKNSHIIFDLDIAKRIFLWFIIKWFKALPRNLQVHRNHDFISFESLLQIWLDLKQDWN